MNLALRRTKTLGCCLVRRKVLQAFESVAAKKMRTYWLKRKLQQILSLYDHT